MLLAVLAALCFEWDQGCHMKKVHVHFALGYYVGYDTL